MTSYIQARLISKADPIQDDLDSLKAAEEIQAEAGRNVVGRIQPNALDEMRYYPSKAKLPFEFDTPKSKRWYFAAINGKIPGVVIPTDGKRYKRTGGLADSMFFEGRETERGFEIVAGSKSPKSKFVVDSFDQQRSYQVAGHKNTGWPKLANTVNFWLETADEEMQNEITSVYVEYRSRRQNR